jgi:hypothetical protein
MNIIIHLLRKGNNPKLIALYLLSRLSPRRALFAPQILVGPTAWRSEFQNLECSMCFVVQPKRRVSSSTGITRFVMRKGVSNDLKLQLNR